MVDCAGATGGPSRVVSHKERGVAVRLYVKSLAAMKEKNLKKATRGRGSDHVVRIP